MLGKTTSVSDVTGEWPLYGSRLSGEWPYHTRYWGETVARVFGGSFKVLWIEQQRTVVLPVLVGGTLAQGGFSSGHIGYGGALPATSGAGIAVDDHLAALRAAEEYLRAPCLRLATAPMPESAASGTDRRAESRTTSLVRLAATEAEQLSCYGQSLPGSIRRSRRAGVDVAEITAESVAEALALIHRTQQDADATYRMPKGILDSIVSAAHGFGLVLGCRHEGRLISVGVFLRASGRAVHLATGWNRELAGLRANYLLMHHAIRRFAGLGDTVLDLGYSHRPGIIEFKRQWGGSPATTWSFDFSVASL